MRALLLAMLVLAPLASAHQGEPEPGLRTAEGDRAMVGNLAGLHAPGAIAVAPVAVLRIEGHLEEYPPPAAPAPGLAVGLAHNATHLSVALQAEGQGWFLIGVDLATATRALVVMRENLVARHAAIGGWVDDAGNLTWCAGSMGVAYPDPTAPEPAGHAGMAMQRGEEVLIAYDGGDCHGAWGAQVAAVRSLGSTRVEAAFPLAALGAQPGEVRHVLVAAEPVRQFLTPKVTEEATRGDVNALLARPGDDPAALGQLVRGAPSGVESLALLAVPLAAFPLMAALRAPKRAA
ncbi:MAG TPA: hypothetical protein VGR28_15135 [Candidatus Thermoplasmatota archaeon]|nr:hypothetical protein [Candidatus Thermoplasmatota archaeon]